MSIQFVKSTKNIPEFTGMEIVNSSLPFSLGNSLPTSQQNKTVLSNKCGKIEKLEPNWKECSHFNLILGLKYSSVNFT